METVDITNLTQPKLLKKMNMAGNPNRVVIYNEATRIIS